MSARDELTILHRCRMCGAEDTGSVIWREKYSDLGKRSSYERDIAGWHNCPDGNVGAWELIGMKRKQEAA